MTANEPRHQGSRTIYMPLRDGWEETEAEREAEAREACSQHLADLQAHAEPPRDVKIPVRFVTCRPMAIMLP
jgi:hypothetical protein